jgi:pimeloyl-ACP methyl ester carboxylesterase
LLRRLSAGNFTTPDGCGPPLVLIPGWTMPARIFAPQLEDLARDFRVIALDPRSQGESQKTTGHHPDRRAQDIAELLARLQLQNVVLAGWSLGVPEVLTCLDRRGVAKKLDRPVLYVVTQQLAKQAEIVRKTKPDARVELFTEAGHALFVDEPERFNELIRAFARVTGDQERRRK